MCGHVGVISSNRLTSVQLKVFRQLLLVGQIRGQHATGVMALEAKRPNDLRVIKRAVNSSDFLDMQDVEDVVDNVLADVSVLLGHNRFATQGAITDANAHPFRHGHITLAHNGTLRNQMLLPDHKRFQVDSENIAYAVAKDGIKDTAPKLNGAYCLVWHDASDGTVNIVRNNERPMCFAVTKDKKTVYYASEGRMLRWILEKNHIQIETYYTLQTHTKITFDLNKAKVGEWEAETLGFYTPPAYSYNRYDGRNDNSLVSRLKRLGLKQQERVEFMYLDFEPYATGDFGVLIGAISTAENEWVDIMCRGFSKHQLPVGTMPMLTGVVYSTIYENKTNFVMVREIQPVRKEKVIRRAGNVVAKPSNVVDIHDPKLLTLPRRI